LLYYPLVGLLMSLLLIGAIWLMSSLPQTITAALALALWVAISGGLHLDGLADSADGWLGGYGDRKRTLKIMHDPYCGPMGVITLVLVLLLKFTALDHLISHNTTMLLFAVPILGRSVLLVLFFTTPYVRPGGLGEQMAQHLPRTIGVIVLFATALLILYGLGQAGAFLLLSSGVTFVLLRHLMIRRLQGTTGDTAGALAECVECTAIVTAAMI
jgi:adenosylcobinamide-GDP ribazoletransferase